MDVLRSWKLLLMGERNPPLMASAVTGRSCFAVDDRVAVISFMAGLRLRAEYV